MRVEEESVSLMDKNGNYVGPTYDNLPPVLPVPAPAGGPLGAPGRSPFVQNVHRYDSARSPSPTPSARGGKPVSPIPNIVVERAVSNLFPHLSPYSLPTPCPLYLIVCRGAPRSSERARTSRDSRP
ncbi:hypothetical protein DL93DRAFT_2077453 [Clavulina sp. PMI_390]|nr:hypothetical protein DL93DRAFT_2077453 [Clavulina sp. PMI_390]